MKHTEIVSVPTQTVISIECDVCHTVYDDHNISEFEIQEFVHIDFIGGYGSVFGDMGHHQLDVCQHCLKKHFGEFIRSSNAINLVDMIANAGPVVDGSQFNWDYDQDDPAGC